MTPELAIVVRIVVSCIATQYLLKRIVGQNRRTERFLWQFGFAFLLGLGWALLTETTIDGRVVVAAMLGAVAACGTFLAWKAIHISQSRNALYTFWDDLIAIGLSMAILNETRFLNGIVGLGIVLSFVSLGCFVAYERVRELKTSVPMMFYVYVGLCSIAWGSTMFGQRYFAAENMPVGEFILGWYTGTLFVAFLIYMFYRDTAGDQKQSASLTVTDIGTLFVLACTIVTSLVLAQYAYRAPLTLVQPIFHVADTVIPALMGLYVFHERKQLDRAQWMFLIVGLAGAVLIGCVL